MPFNCNVNKCNTHEQSSVEQSFVTDYIIPVIYDKVIIPMYKAHSDQYQVFLAGQEKNR